MGRSKRKLSYRAYAQLFAQAAHDLALAAEECLQAEGARGELLRLRDDFQRVSPSLTPEEFPSIYAQCVTYVLLAARVARPVSELVNRREVGAGLPKGYGLLPQLYGHIADGQLDLELEARIESIMSLVNSPSCLELLARSISEGYNPLVHFYEVFLGEYAPSDRKSHGVWYTPCPVVRFIVRGVHELLLQDFSPDGGKPLALYLDPSTGTGTFLREVVRHAHQEYSGAAADWSDYVDGALMPSLHGLEIMIPAHIIAELNLVIELERTGYSTEGRMGVAPDFRVRNSLQEDWLSSALRDKGATLPLVVLGNPPYSVSSENRGAWISTLVEEYKRGVEERNMQPLSDDYIKFIRLAQYYVEQHGQGIVAYITNSSYLDGMIHRAMRRQLLETFERVYILNLHGDERTSGKMPASIKDQNVFPIMQGVCILLAVRASRPPAAALGRLYHLEVMGTREKKLRFLDEAPPIAELPWTEITPRAPHYFFDPRDFSGLQEYETYFGLDELFPEKQVGIVTSRDCVTIWETKEGLEAMLGDLLCLEVEEFRAKYYVGADTANWSVERAMRSAREGLDASRVRRILYRPFDVRYIYHCIKSNGLLSRPSTEIMRHMDGRENLALIACRLQSSGTFRHAFVTRELIDKCTISTQPKESNYLFPLYCLTCEGGYKPNFDARVLGEIEKRLGARPEPLQLFDYIYAVLHSPWYRAKYREMLRIGFPRIPYAPNWDTFRKLSGIGARLRTLHLLEGDAGAEASLILQGVGDCRVTNIRYDGGKLWINPRQYFTPVEEAVWSFWLGGYQLPRKWLKDRKGRRLSSEEFQHYGRILHAIRETLLLMPEVDACLYEGAMAD